MDLLQAVAYAAVQGVSSALPISASGHQLASSIWLGSDTEATRLVPVAQLGAVLGVLAVVRRRLVVAFAQGIRGVARPSARPTPRGGTLLEALAHDGVAIPVAAVVAGGLQLWLQPRLAALASVPLVVGLAMLLTAAGLLSTAFAPPPRHTCPGLLGALLVGVAYGLAIIPGASQIGAAFVIMRWLSLDRWRAAELALLISVPLIALDTTLWFAREGSAAFLFRGQAVLTVLVSFLLAAMAATWWRALCERRRTVWLNLWLVPLSLTLLAYGQALPG